MMMCDQAKGLFGAKYGVLSISLSRKWRQVGREGRRSADVESGKRGSSGSIIPTRINLCRCATTRSKFAIAAHEIDTSF